MKSKKGTVELQIQRDFLDLVKAFTFLISNLSYNNHIDQQGKEYMTNLIRKVGKFQYKIKADPQSHKSEKHDKSDGLPY